MTENTLPRMHVCDHSLTVRLDWARPDGETIEIFAREVVAPEKRGMDLPVLAFLQGGPGGRSPRPASTGPA